MNLSKNNEPWSLLRDFREEVDRLFNKNLPVGSSEFPSLAWNTNGQRYGFWPEVDIEDNEKNYVITANVPGIEAKDLDINYNNGNLVIKGETSSKREEKSKNYVRIERSEGSFCRSFALPDIDEQKIEANYKDGLLTINLPKKESTTAKKIKVKT